MKITDILYLGSNLKNDTLFKGEGNENLIARHKPSLNRFNNTLRGSSVLTDSWAFTYLNFS